MGQIFKFSQVYDPAQDRIAWDTEDTEGNTTRLWLTQRLCRGFLKGVLTMVKTTSASDIPARHESTVQSWEQAAAMAEFGKIPPVRPRPESVEGLVSTVNIAPSGDGVVLRFHFGQDEPTTLALRHTEARQMLTVLYRLHAAASWPLDLWPAWIAEPPDLADAPPNTVN